MSSQQTYEAVLNRFKNANVLVQGWVDYSPGNTLILKAALAAFIPTVESANTEVTGAETALSTIRHGRNLLVFEIEDTNPTCLETRIRGIENYLSSDPDNDAFNAA